MVKKDFKEKYMEHQVLMQQLQQLQENISSLDKHILDLKVLNDNLDSIGKTESGKDTLMPLGSGIFVNGTLKDNKSVIMNVGANICVEKSVEEAKQTIDKQIEDVGNLLEQLQVEITNTSFRLQELQNEFQNIREESLGD